MSYYNTNASEVNNCDRIEIEQSKLRILKCMLCPKPKCGNAISHAFKHVPFHSILCHGRLYEIIKL